MCKERYTWERCGMPPCGMGKIHSIKYDEIMSVVANSKDPEILRLSQLILTEEERDHMVSLVRGISKGTQGNSVWKQTQTHRLGRPNQHSWRPSSQGGPNQLTSIAIYTLIGVNSNHFFGPSLKRLYSNHLYCPKGTKKLKKKKEKATKY